MFYHLEELLGKIVTIKTVSGHEYIGKLLGTNEDNSVLTMYDLQSILIIGDMSETQQVIMVPYTVTSDSREVFMQTNNMLSIAESMEDTAKEFETQIGDTDK